MEQRSAEYSRVVAAGHLSFRLRCCHDIRQREDLGWAGEPAPSSGSGSGAVKSSLRAFETRANGDAGTDDRKRNQREPD
jgi:hypothetical protein